MCDNICKNEKKYVLGPLPMFIPQRVNASPCTTMEDCPAFETMSKPAIKNIVQETTINVPKVEYREKVIEVPRIEYRTYPVVKEVETPVYKDVYKYKNVQVPQKQFRLKPVYKVVEVPQVKYVDKYVKRKYKRFKYIPREVQIPFRPRREIYSEIPIPRYIPQYMNSSVQPETLDTAYTGQLPLFEGYNDSFLHMMNPFSLPNKREKDNCLLSCLCNGNTADNASYEMDQALFSSPTYAYHLNNKIPCCSKNTYELRPEEFAVLGHSYPLVVHEEENYFYNSIIEATSSILAAAGVALVLAGKLSIQGISLLLKGGDIEKGNAMKDDNKGKDKMKVLEVTDDSTGRDETKKKKKKKKKKR
ncbi:inner membrane complex protein 1m, putative [Plasmodium ovale]|uniref:Inner membrane complex protein 1m, putative n=1 Tax=Plasmodium ovale TaxID=36330 RepID=A0A1C3KPU5_PLAOA|nr:inner membrane complex protein 1m, putative [Plasmodium ovale]